jgi:ABC-type multidrug transport system fused ATPase/permease subunit
MTDSRPRIERGSHDDLMALRGTCFKMVQRQLATAGHEGEHLLA